VISFLFSFFLFCLFVWVVIKIVRIIDRRLPAVLLAVLTGLCCTASAQEPPKGGTTNIQQKGDSHPTLAMMHLDTEVRERYRNPDGSCVQCSIGMCGSHCNEPAAARLLWNSEFGPAVRGGSWPARVEKYCDERHIRAWSVTGATVDETIPWIIWSAKTGRFAAIGAGTAHFQTLYGYDAATNEFLLCNNNSPQRVDRYNEQQFRALHAASGPWCVILHKPSSPPPKFVKWWE
jgi:hypothetical protein